MFHYDYYKFHPRMCFVWIYIEDYFINIDLSLLDRLSMRMRKYDYNETYERRYFIIEGIKSEMDKGPSLILI